MAAEVVNKTLIQNETIILKRECRSKEIFKQLRYLNCLKKEILNSNFYTYYTRSVASEYGEYNVRVNSVSPGFLEKGMSNVKNFIKLNDPRVFENSMNNTPMHRVGKPTELIGAVLYLLSDASTYTTGIDIMIDGGYHVW